MTQSSLYAILLILSGCTAILVAAAAWPRRSAPGGGPLILMNLSMLVWTWTYALHWLLPSWPAPFFWLDATYLGVVSLPGLHAAFATQVTRRDHWPNLPTRILLAIIPALTLLILWTDPHHGLFFDGMRQPGVDNILNGGPWFWVNVAYSYGLELAAFAVMFVGYRRTRGAIYRRQIGACLLAGTFLFVVNLAAIAGFTPFPGLDLTPVLFILTGIAYLYAIIPHRMFDLSPVALDTLVDHMQDGLLVIDRQQRIVEVNPAAARTLNGERAALVGQPAAVVLFVFPELLQALNDFSASTSGVQRLHLTTSNHPRRTLDSSLVTLQNGTTPAGMIITWRDITPLIETQEKLNEHILKISALQESLRKQAIHDPLTGLPNRRFLDETLPVEIARAARSETNISFMMLDLDNFKVVNDTFGHLAGDQVLQQVGQRLTDGLRRGDVVARLGGDEFVIVLVGASRAVAIQRADQLRHSITGQPVSFDSGSFSITASIGVATFPEHGSTVITLMAAADKALYLAKASGRNRVAHTEPAISVSP